MENNTFFIKHKGHTKLYVLPKDQIVFESQMDLNNIPFYTDINSQPYTDTGIRYFILDSHRLKINSILKEKNIIASTETIPSYDYRDQKKIGKFTFAIVAIMVILIGLLLWL